MDAALAVARLLGLAFIAHGLQKVSHWGGGRGLAGSARWMEHYGFRPGKFYALLSAVTLGGGGLLILIGLGGPVGPALLLAAMVVATLGVNWPNGFFAQNMGCEVSLVYSALLLVFAYGGFGDYGLDHVLGIRPFSTGEITFALTAAVISGVAVVALRRRTSQHE